MAVASTRLIDALSQTADRLNRGDKYAWTHMGSCNCGHLAQTITQLSGEQIHGYALEKAGDWSEQVTHWCSTSKYPIDHVIQSLINIGLDLDDLTKLERLSDRRILLRIPPEMRELHYKNRHDVVLYLQTWADLLREELQAQETPIFAGELAHA